MTRDFDYCAICLARWDQLTLDEKKRTSVPPATTTVKQTRVCTPCDSEIMQDLLERIDIEAHS